MNQNDNNPSSFAAFIGLDKSDKKINVSLQRCGKSKIERSVIKAGAEALHLLRRNYGGRAGPARLGVPRQTSACARQGHFAQPEL